MCFEEMKRKKTWEFKYINTWV